MHRIKPIKEILQKLSSDKAAFSIIHINGKKSKACLPFVVKPAASDDGLSCFVVAEPVHDQQEYKSPPSVICLQEYGDSQQCQYADKLHFLIIPEVFQRTECQVSQKQGKKYILLLISPGIGKHKVPWNLRDTCK